MKSILSIAILATALCASADDQYLYWMIDDSSELVAADGTTKTPLTGSYYAKVKTNSGDYLNFYETPGGSPIGGVDNFAFKVADIKDNIPTFAGVFTGTPVSFIIELYSDAGSAPGSWVGQATLEWNSDYITSGGMGHATPGSVNSFSAVPEPTSGLLLLLGVAGLALRRKNKKA